jgi:hypothetical protein
MESSRLTNEQLAKKFNKSNFELVNYAIKLAENMIRTGRDARVKSDVQNRAMLVLEEIHEGKDHFDEIIDRSAPPKENVFNGEDIQPEMTYEEKRRRSRASFADEDEE